MAKKSIVEALKAKAAQEQASEVAEIHRKIDLILEKLGVTEAPAEADPPAEPKAPGKKK